jgi:Reverse transcriptase (RNA-dependent DNA polymerase)
MIVELADVETTYLNAALHEFVHAEQPPYFELKSHAEYVLLLNRALYGLPQPGFEWAAILRAALKAFGFCSMADDENLYVGNVGGRCAVLVLYCDFSASTLIAEIHMATSMYHKPIMSIEFSSDFT